MSVALRVVNFFLMMIVLNMPMIVSDSNLKFGWRFRALLFGGV